MERKTYREIKYEDGDQDAELYVYVCVNRDRER